MESEERRRARLASNEALYRSVNEQIEDLSQTFGLATDEPLEVVCECATVACTQRISIEVSRYERVRSDPTLFIVAEGHEVPDVEDVVDRGGGYAIVCKHQGAGGAVAVATDPRG
jgi:hypothetical protein